MRPNLLMVEPKPPMPVRTATVYRMGQSVVRKEPRVSLAQMVKECGLKLIDGKVHQ